MKTIRFFYYLLACARAWKLAQHQGTAYAAVENEYGGLQTALFVAEGREAWRTTQFALEARLIVMPGVER